MKFSEINVKIKETPHYDVIFPYWHLNPPLRYFFKMKSFLL